MSMQHSPILLGLLTVGACFNLTVLTLRLLGLPREQAFYGACLIVTLSLYLLSRHLLRRQ